MNVAGFVAATALWGPVMTVASAGTDTRGADADVVSAVVIGDRKTFALIDATLNGKRP
jgi:hypothetical protein